MTTEDRIEQAPDTTSRMTRWLIWLRPVVSLLVVNALAMFGQVLFGLDNYAPGDWPWPARLTVAIGAAAALESMSLYVQWHAHDALLRKASATAARLRRRSYLIAAAVAAMNYSHFCGPHGEPTPAAVLFAACSLASPWLWGLHTRRAANLQLLRERRADSSGAVFGAERWRMFPLRTWGALRYSIEHSIDDPREAWIAYNAERTTRRAAQVAADTPAADAEPGKPSLVKVPRLSLAPRLNTTARDDDAARASARRWIHTQGRMPKSRAEWREATGTGGKRTERISEQLLAEHDRTGTDQS